MAGNMIHNYDEMSISTFNKIRKVLSEPMGELDMQANVVSILSDMPVEDVYNLPLSKYEKLVYDTAFIMNPVKHSGKRIPDRIVMGDMVCHITKPREITTAQYIDYQTISSNKDKDYMWSNILACFIVPEGCKYGEGYDILDVIKWLDENMSIQQAVDVCFFFRKKYLKSIKKGLTSLGVNLMVMSWTEKNKETKRNLKKAAREAIAMSATLRENGDGLQW